jgi:hypothetical protein
MPRTEANAPQNNIAAAKLAGIVTDLNLKGVQFQVRVSGSVRITDANRYCNRHPFLSSSSAIY